MVWRKKPAQRREDRRQPSEQIQTEMFLSASLVIHYGAEAFQRREARHAVDGATTRGRTRPARICTAAPRRRGLTGNPAAVPAETHY